MTPPASPDPYEERLCTALMQILGRGTHDLPGIVAALNAAGIADPGGKAWTEAEFVAVMGRLGAGPEHAALSAPDEIARIFRTRRR